MPYFNNHWQELKEALRAQALAIGFDVARFAPATPPPTADNLLPWLEKGCHGEMAWLTQNTARRQDPGQLMEGVGVVLVLGSNYRPAESFCHTPPRMGISAYARNNDYHDHLKKRLKRLSRWLRDHLGEEVNTRGFVDTAPVMEKPLAATCGIGWQGKNALLISRQYGAWLLLSELFLPFPLPPDPPEPDRCGSCNRCQLACPTGALDIPYRLEARNCIAYLTVEYKGPIPLHLRRAMGNRVFGCDDCIEACPWNRFAPATGDEAFLPRESLTAPSLLEFADLDEDTFRAVFRKSPIKRIGRERFLRNLAVALGNWGAPEALSALERLRDDPSPLVQSHALWGLDAALMPDKNTREKNDDVRDAGKKGCVESMGKAFYLFKNGQPNN
ncbi:MAG: tRNA epoxyqueuosine(34) reductase QueG [Magnetococcales bacterium]|nr:tRNA epoxyqueuosine(34) reductase QueG [Magnetococcales bacterium]